MGKDLSKLNMDAITGGAEMTENTEGNDTSAVRSRRAQKKPRKVFRSYSLSMELNDYEEFLDYLDENNIDSGAKLVRNLLRDAGILSSEKE